MNAVESRASALRQRMTRSPLQSVPADPKPAEAVPETVRVYNDQTRELAIIAYADLRDYQSRGFSLVPANVRDADLPRAPEPKPGLSVPFPPVAGNGGHIGAYQSAALRRELFKTVAPLCERVQAEPLKLEAWSRGHKTEIAALYNLVIVAQIAGQLCDRVDALETQLARQSAEMAALIAAGVGGDRG